MEEVTAMNRIKMALTLAFLLSFAGFVYGQEPQDEPRQKPEQTRPEPRPETTPPGRQEEAKPPKAEKQETPKPPKESKPGHEEKGQMGEQGHARPAGKSAHIPDPKFKASFGRPHSFKANQVIRQTTIVAGQTQFVYSGYTFIILDPWPSEWLFTDDCYIDYVDDDYFLFDPFHPGIRIALFVVG
jgi:hypothetical protein